MDRYLEELHNEVRLMIPAKGFPWLRETLGALGLGKISSLSVKRAEAIVGKKGIAAAKRSAKRPSRSAKVAKELQQLLSDTKGIGAAP